MKLTFIAVMALLATSAFAQGPGSGGPGPRAAAPRLDSLKEYLSLTDAQVTQLTQLRTQQFEANRGLREELSAKSRALRDLLNAPSPNAAAIGQAMLELQAIRKKLEGSNETRQSQAQNILTAPQKEKLKELEAAAALQDEIRQAAAVGLLDREDFGFMMRGNEMRGTRGAGRGRMMRRSVRL
ncbi:MAG: periplasmic heavy metal sensor [Bryobacteraceae bacterium]|nr:periplasmic heavy metal sensor [Bryobacteraceae bacterium]